MVGDAAVETTVAGETDVIAAIATIINQIQTIVNTASKTATQFNLYLRRVAVTKNKKQHLLLYHFLIQLLKHPLWINLKSLTSL